MQKLKVAFAGFRHGHIYALYDKMLKHPEIEIVAICEEDEPASLLAKRPEIKLTDTDFDAMLKRVDCDAVAIGDYYTKRGSMAIRALEAGKHVIADKPLCTSLAELDRIEALAAKTGLKVGCMYELRFGINFAAARALIKSGRLGKLLQIQFGGQHPLQLASRPGWYFEDGKHGGAINDIGSHALDVIPWMTGLKVAKIHGARNWQANPGAGFLKEAGQFMLELDNGCGVVGDVSYASPDSFGFTLGTYWRFNIWGTLGMVEFNFAGPAPTVWFDGAKAGVPVELPAAPGDYLDSFLLDLAGKKPELDTAMVIESARRTLEVQLAADRA